MMMDKCINSTSCQAVDSLVGNIEETLITMRQCPKKLRLERIYSGLRREQETLEKAVRHCDTTSEHKSLHRIASKIARYYRTLGTNGQG